MYNYIAIPESLLIAAQNDPVLNGNLNTSTNRVGIYYEDKIVGFYSPTIVLYKMHMHHRTGNIFILPEYRSKGLGTKTIIEFFLDKHYGLAQVAFDNAPSMRAFEKAGFVKSNALPEKNIKGKDLILLIKEPVSIPGFCNWK
jgi:predicted acetyltransferase